VVARRPDRAGNVRAVVVVVHRVAGTGDRVVAVGTGRAAPDAARVRPDVGRQVGVGIVDARVHHGHHHVFRAGRHRPGGHRLDVGPGRGIEVPIDDLAGVLQP